MKRPIFTPGNIYHVYNRGTDKRDIFLDEEDYLRGVHDLWEFNDENPAANAFYKLISLKTYEVVKTYEVGLRKMGKQDRQPRKLLVKIHAFVLMKNHFHLLLESFSAKGISEFMRKFGTGYTNYFNQKYKRAGGLFQGKFKAIHITKDAHFIHIPYYIHCNPLDYFDIGWRRGEIVDTTRTIQFLEEYRWSSFPDYIGKKNFPSVTYRDFLTRFLVADDWRSAINNWLKNFNEDTTKELSFE